MSVPLPTEPLEAAIATVPRRGRAWLRLAIVLSFLLLGAGLAIAASRSRPEPPRLAFKTAPLKKLRKQKPQFVLIGNSMVYTRFSERALNRVLAPKKAVLITAGGSKSSIWYLYFKNYVVASKRRFERVVFFFRGNELTLPRLGTTGRDASRLMRASAEPDPVVEAKLAPPKSEPLNRLRWRLKRLAPVERLHSLIAEPLDSWAVLTSRVFGKEVDLEARMEAINGVFAMDELRDIPAAPPAEPDELNFHDALEESFLPDIFELAEQHHIPIAFVRVRTRAMADGIPDAPDEAAYLRDLRAYVERRGALYVDMRYADWEAPEMYHNGDHIARKFTAIYTRLFVEHVPQVFR